MYRSILVPLDGSEFAENALPAALALAARCRAELRLVRAREAAPAYRFASALVGPDGVGVPDLLTEPPLVTEEWAYLASVANRLRQEAGIRVTVAVLDGPVATALGEHAAELENSLVVLATHGRGRLRRFWLGSVAHGVVRRSSLPVLLIPPRGAERGPRAEHLFRNILIPLDGSPDAETIVPHAVALGSLGAADYTVLQVLPPSTLVGYTVPDDGEAVSWSELEERAAGRSLEHQAAIMRLQSLGVKKRVVRHGSAAAAILEYAGESGADLIAMASHGHGWGQLILGDVADEVVRRSAVPILHYHPPDR